MSRRLSKQQVVRRTIAFAKNHHGKNADGHDWPHIERVWKMAKRIARTEHADIFIVEIAALLHDIADWKDSGDEYASAHESRKFLGHLGVDEQTIKKVEYIVTNVSFKGAKVPDKMPFLEGKIVQDADRLDAIGAIAIARTFAWGGSRGRQIYSPSERWTLHKTFKAYAHGGNSSIAHFYEKLLLLKRRLHTRTARRLAAPRHAFMQAYLRQFFQEWQGK